MSQVSNNNYAAIYIIGMTLCCAMSDFGYFGQNKALVFLYRYENCIDSFYCVTSLYYCREIMYMNRELQDISRISRVTGHTDKTKAYVIIKSQRHKNTSISFGLKNIYIVMKILSILFVVSFIRIVFYCYETICTKNDKRSKARIVS